MLLTESDGLGLTTETAHVGLSGFAGPLGFAGTVSKGSGQATGLATLTDDGFGSGPNMPMLPTTWTPEGERDDS